MEQEKRNATFSLTEATLKKLHRYSMVLMVNKSLYVENAILNQMELDLDDFEKGIGNINDD